MMPSPKFTTERLETVTMSFFVAPAELPSKIFYNYINDCHANYCYKKFSDIVPNPICGLLCGQSSLHAEIHLTQDDFGFDKDIVHTISLLRQIEQTENEIL